MGRSLFKRCIVLSLFLIAQTQESQADGMLTFDMQTFTTLKSVLSTAGQSLQQLQTLSGEMMEMNSVLGSKLDPSLLQKVMNVGTLSGDFNSLLNSLSGQGGDSLMQLNYMRVQHGGKQDYSHYIYAKNYFQQKFFPEQNSITPTQLSEIRDSKLQSMQLSTVDSLAIATQQKETLREDHFQLQKIKQQAEQNPTLKYQATIQTRLLEHIAHQLDKIILIQTQQLELMATYMAQAQPTVFKSPGNMAKERK